MHCTVYTAKVDDQVIKIVKCFTTYGYIVTYKYLHVQDLWKYYVYTKTCHHSIRAYDVWLYSF